MQNPNITEQYIYNLFETENLVEVEIGGEKRRSERLQTVPQHLPLSTNAIRILEHLSPESQERMIQDFYFDDLKLMNKQLQEEDEDISYIYFENKEIGPFIELWLCANMRCPGCKTGRLVKYANPNMPVIDVKCSNSEHTLFHGPKYYQIKSSESGTVFHNQNYFNLFEKYIKVGSPRYGKICHDVKVGDDINKKQILIGYICIEYVYPSDITRKISINLNKSFILIPNLQIYLQIPDNDYESLNLKYYTYLSEAPLPVITFDERLFKIYTLNMFAEEQNISKSIFNNINVDLIFNTTEHIPEYLKRRLIFQKKYLKYKQKYLKLKKNIYY
jgi:hypothetical protein